MTKATPPNQAENDMTDVHVILPKLMWQAVAGMARKFGTSKTNIVVRALNKEAYFARVLDQDPDAKVWIVRSNGDKEQVVFI